MKELAPRGFVKDMTRRAVGAWSVEVGARLGAGIMLAITAVTVWERKMADLEMARKRVAPRFKK